MNSGWNCLLGNAHRIVGEFKEGGEELDHFSMWPSLREAEDTNEATASGAGKMRLAGH